MDPITTTNTANTPAKDDNQTTQSPLSKNASQLNDVIVGGAFGGTVPSQSTLPAFSLDDIDNQTPHADNPFPNGAASIQANSVEETQMAFTPPPAEQVVESTPPVSPTETTTNIPTEDNSSTANTVDSPFANFHEEEVQDLTIQTPTTADTVTDTTASNTETVVPQIQETQHTEQIRQPVADIQTENPSETQTEQSVIGEPTTPSFDLPDTEDKNNALDIDFSTPTDASTKTEVSFDLPDTDQAGTDSLDLNFDSTATSTAAEVSFDLPDTEQSPSPVEITFDDPELVEERQPSEHVTNLSFDEEVPQEVAPQEVSPTPSQENEGQQNPSPDTVSVTSDMSVPSPEAMSLDDISFDLPQEEETTQVEEPVELQTTPPIDDEMKVEETEIDNITQEEISETATDKAEITSPITSESIETVSNTIEEASETPEITEIPETPSPSVELESTENNQTEQVPQFDLEDDQFTSETTEENQNIQPTEEESNEINEPETTNEETTQEEPLDENMTNQEVGDEKIDVVVDEEKADVVTTAEQATNDEDIEQTPDEQEIEEVPESDPISQDESADKTPIDTGDTDEDTTDEDTDQDISDEPEDTTTPEEVVADDDNNSDSEVWTDSSHDLTEESDAFFAAVQAMTETNGTSYFDIVGLRTEEQEVIYTFTQEHINEISVLNSATHDMLVLERTESGLIITLNDEQIAYYGKDTIDHEITHYLREKLGKFTLMIESEHEKATNAQREKNKLIKQCLRNF